MYYGAVFEIKKEIPVYVSTCPQNYKFTGKERDPDMHVDYFGARFYNYNMARFYSPDWSAIPTSVPYADLDDPQTLNLYSYVRNNPLARADADGHASGGNEPKANYSPPAFDLDFAAQAWVEFGSYQAVWMAARQAQVAAQQQVSLPQNSDANLLTHLVFNEATSSGITTANSEKEMGAIAYTAVNWSDYLSSHPKYKPSWIGASGTSIDDGVHAQGQYGGVGGARWNLVDNQKGLTKGDLTILSRAASVAEGVVAGRIADPYGGKTYGMRTLGSGSPGKNYTALPQIEGSRNTFYTVTLP